MVRLIERLENRRCDERGAVVLLVAAMTVILFALAALVVDLGQARVIRGEAQAASDASALAAGNALYLAGTSSADVTGAIAAAKSYALKNYNVKDADWAGCVDPGALSYKAPGTQCISFNDATQPSKVRVVAPVRGVSLFFGSAFGVRKVDISAQAEVSMRVGSAADCGLCIVGNGYHDLQNGDAYISGGNVSINGSVNIQNNGLVSTNGVISVEGTATGPLDGYTPDPLTGQQPVDDPLAALPLPSDFSSMPRHTNPCGDGNDRGPGVYGSWDFPDDNCVLQPGLYVVTGEWRLSGNENVTGPGVTLYFTCGTTTSPRACNAPGEYGGWLNAHGNGTIQLTAPASGPWKGLVMAYDRLNTRDLWLSGNGESTYSGTIYAVSATLEYDGNSCQRTHQSLIVVKSLEFSGNNGCIRSNYTQSANVYVPPDGLHLSS